MSELNGLEGRSGIVFSPDGRILVTCSGDRAVRLWDTATSQLLHVLTLPQVPNCRRVAPNVAFSSDGRELAVVSGANVMFFDVASGALRGSLDGYSFTATLAFSRDSSALIVVNGYEVLTLDARSGELLQTRLSDEPVKSIAISPDGSLMAWGGGGQQYWLQLWDVARGEALYTVEDEIEPVDEVAFSPDGQLLATQSGQLWRAPLAQVRDAGSGKLLFSHEAIHFAFSPDGRFFATSSPEELEKAAIEVWDATTFQLVHRFERLALLAFSPDGNILALRWMGNLVRASRDSMGWRNIDSGELLRPFETPLSLAMAFSPDGRLLLGHEHDPFGETGIWDMMTGKLLWRVELMSAGVFSPDGRLLATVSRDGVVRLWGLEIGD